MLTLYRSNLVESLLDLLARRLSDAPLASPFTPEIVVTPSPAMARWVQLGLARAHGIAANLSYPLPASFVWQLAHDQLNDPPEADPLALEPMAWRIFWVLPGLLSHPSFAPLRRYLAGDPTSDSGAIKRWQLAARIADTFDRYQLYRPELIRAWSDPDTLPRTSDATAAESWQPLLWRRLIKGLSHHRVAVIDRLLASLGGPAPQPGLPERVALFAVSSLPPLLVEVMRALAARTQVDLYLHCPTDQFWADLVTQKAQARRRLDHPEDADLWEVGHPLLSSWGRQGQALQDLLLEGESAPVEIDAWVEPPRDTLLHCLQHDIYHLTGHLTGPAAGALTLDPDDSLQIQICHSPFRECQVLHDWLLDLFETDDDLRPEHCLVMIPEIDGYAPYIQAVFERDPSGARPYIPWNLSDVALRDEHPLIQVFLQILDLPQSRFGRTEILSYLDVPELAQTFGLDAQAVAQVKAWLTEARLRWGLDAEHKRRLGLPPMPENTWAQVERRLFGGYALGDGAAPGCGPDEGPEPTFADIAPIAGIEGNAAAALGQFWSLLDTLERTASDLAGPRGIGAWRDTLTQLLATFFGEAADPDGRIQKIRDALADLMDQAGALAAGPPDQANAGEPIPLALVRHWLEERLSQSSRHGRYFRGGVTFCGMRPMRSLPFQVICCLGLQDGVFPRLERPLEIDLMRRSWRPGDPRKGDEDRYLFLETLLCARRRLYLSYVGRDLRRNAERQPSVLLRELLDVIDQRYRLPPNATGVPDQGQPPARLSDRLTRVAPLQPFSPSNYGGLPEAAPGPAGRRGGEQGRSFDAGWCELARASLAATSPAQADGGGSPDPWPTTPLAPAPEALREVSLTQLERWLRNPLGQFLATRLQIVPWTEEVEPDDEPFALDPLQHFALKQRLLRDRLQGTAVLPRDDSRQVRALAAQGELPHGAFGRLTYEETCDQVAPVLEQVGPYLGSTPQQIRVDLAFDPDADLGLADGPYRLAGQIPGLYAGLGLLRVRPAKLKGVDILTLWLHHLAWCAAVPALAGQPRVSRLVTEDRVFQIADDLAQAAARAQLARYLRLYWEGIHRPLPILPRTTFACAQSLHQGKDPTRAVLEAWLGNDFQGPAGERDDPCVQMVLRGRAVDPLKLPELVELAQALYGDVLAREAGDERVGGAA